jgi:DNA-binding LytR/AlgR family response regulator
MGEEIQDACLEVNTANENFGLSNTETPWKRLKGVYDNKKYIVVDIEDVVYAEAANNMTIIHLTNQKICVSHILKNVTEFFGLQRVHKSYSINVLKIVCIDNENSEIVLEGNKSVFFSRTFDFKKVISILK